MKTIEIEISETDRITAAPYQDNHNCIIATALKNLGFNVRAVYPRIIFLEDGAYRCEQSMSEFVCEKFYAQEAPFYYPGVVGKKITLVAFDNESEKVESGEEMNQATEIDGNVGAVEIPCLLSSPGPEPTSKGSTPSPNLVSVP